MRTNAARRFTEADIAAAKETDLPSLLSSLGYQVKRVGRYYTTKEMDSLRIKDRRTWYRYSEGRGGDAITFLQRFCGKSFPEAVEYLLTYHGKARDPPRQLLSKPEQREKTPFTLPAPHPDQRRVFAYLRKRGVAAQVIQDFIRAGLLYEDAEHHNCVFVGRDSSGQPRFASKRGTYDRNGSGFKGDVPGSDKSIVFPLPCNPAIPWVAVFEAPIDLMSFCTLHREVRSNAVALCGLHNEPLNTYLRENPHLRHIVLCLDADEPGREAMEQMISDYKQQGFTVSVRTPKHGKDWNEYLQQRTSARERWR